MVWKGIWGPPLLSNLGPPSNSGLQGVSFQPLNITYGAKYSRMNQVKFVEDSL